MNEDTVGASVELLCVFLSAQLYVRTTLTVQPKHSSDFVVMANTDSTIGARTVSAPS